MRVPDYKMGTEDWAQAVFTSKPARELKGPSRWTQLHGYHSARLGDMQVQGRNEFCSALAIEYLVQNGYVQHAKPQPFKTSKEEFGREICPDFLIKVPLMKERQLFVIETKSHRFLSPAKLWELDELRAEFAKSNIGYILWTDSTPLNKPVRDHLMHMRLSSNNEVSPTEIDTLLAWVDAKGHGATIGNLPVDSSIDRDTVYAAAWDGLVYLPLTKPLTKDTLITTTPQDDLLGMFLGESPRTDAWWSELQPY